MTGYRWRLECPTCGLAYVVGFRAPWSCPSGQRGHGPVLVTASSKEEAQS